VKQAIDRGAVIVVTRAYREWRMAVPGLGSYANLVRTIQVRAPSIGPGNIEREPFKLVSAALRGEHGLPADVDSRAYRCPGANTALDQPAVATTI
jgi:hypothetical protein